MTPTLSPDGTRLAYVRLAPNARIWISSVAGSTPARLTSEDSNEYAPTWSPDGNWIVFEKFMAGASLSKVRVGSGTLPVVLKQGIVESIPEWSPTEEWIVCRTDQGWELVSPDGQKNRVLGFKESPALVFSKDGKTLYGLLREQGQATLFAVDVATGKGKTIGPVGDITPGSPLTPGIRFSLSPDGKSFITSVIRRRSDIWMLEGFDYRPSLLERLGLRR